MSDIRPRGVLSRNKWSLIGASAMFVLAASAESYFKPRKLASDYNAMCREGTVKLALPTTSPKMNTVVDISSEMGKTTAEPGELPCLHTLSTAQGKVLAAVSYTVNLQTRAVTRVTPVMPTP